MKARLILSPLDAPTAEIQITAPTRLLDVFPDVEVMEWFSDGGCIRLNGHLIAPEKWPCVTVKPHDAAHLDFIYVPRGKKTFALLATIAVIALTTAITGGLAAPFFGSAFAAGSIGASLLAAGVGLAGSLAISALTAPPKSSNIGGAENASLTSAGVSGNTLTILDTLPVVFGKIGTSPPMLAPFYTVWDGDDVIAHAVVGVEGRCLIENVKINGLPATDFPGSVVETREGGGADTPRTLFTQTVIEEREGITLSSFKTELSTANNDLLLDQATPDEASPQWHVFRTAGTWDEVVFRLAFPSGIVNTSTSAEAFVPVRLEARKVGGVAWRKFPVAHIYDRRKGAGPFRVEIRVKRSPQPSGRHFSNASGEYPIFELNNHTSVGQSFAYLADAYFRYGFIGTYTYPPSLLPDMTATTTSGHTITASSAKATKDAWRVSDTNAAGGLTDTSYWSPLDNSLPAWLQIQFPAAVTLRSYFMTSNFSSGTTAPTTAPTRWHVSGSNDGVNFVRLDEFDVDVSVDPLPVGSYQIGTPGSYVYYRFTFAANNGAANQELRVSELLVYDFDALGTAFGPDRSSNSGAFCHRGEDGEHSRCRYGSLTKNGATFFLDPAQWEPGEYEFRIKRGVAGLRSSLLITNFFGDPYAYGGSVPNTDFFDYRLVSSLYKIFIGQKDYRSDCTIEAFQTIENVEPFDGAGLALVAVSVPNAQISSIYAEFTRYAPVWDGAAWNANEVPTTNPAALYRQLLLGGANAKPVPGESIGEATHAAWYATCAALGHEANAVLQGARVGEAKQLIATAGYASPRDAEIYEIIEDKDTSAEPVRYAITPLNSKNEGDSSELPDIPDAIRAEFADQTQTYAVDHIIVYRAGQNAASAKVFETFNYAGFTDSAKVTARAAFDLKQAQFRQVRYSRRMGLDGFQLKRGMLVGLGDDVVDGDKAAGWITAVTIDSGNVVAITLDNIMPWSAATDLEQADDIEAITDIVNPSSPMGVSIRIPGQNNLEKQVSNISDGNVCTFTTPFADDGSIVKDLLVVAGQWGHIMRRCKVMSVVPTGFEERVVELADEAPELFA